MTRFLLILLVLQCALASNSIKAQPNIVPNGSFEYHSNTSCASGYGQVTNYCTGWNNFNGSPDFHQTCNNLVPSNAWGYQWPADGNNYIGLADFSGSSTNYGIREAIMANITPMQVGATYEVSLSVSVGDRARYFTNGLCVHFYKNGGTTYNSLGNFTPKISFNSSQLTDTANWVRLTATVVADTAYDHIAIGGFLNAGSLSYSATNFSSTAGYGLWFIDSVVVKLAKKISITFNDTLACAGDTINVPYIVDNSASFYQTNNVFTLQLSDAAGSFSNPVNIGTKTSNVTGTIVGVIPTNTTSGTGYRIRMISSNGADTTFNNGVDIGIGTTVPAKPVANNNGPLCANDTLLLTATTTTNGVSYRWTGPNSFTSATQNPSIPNPVPANGGAYIVTAYIYGCEAKDTTTAVVYAGSGPLGTVASTNSPICADDTLRLFGTANGSSNTYSWSGPNSFTSNTQNPTIPNSAASQSGDYVLYASNGNCTSRDTVTVLVKPRPANFTSTSNSPLCTGATINFTTSSTSTGVTYAWSGPNGFNSTSTTPFINGSSAVHNGDYYVTATLSGCSLSDTLPVTVKPLPNKPVANSNSAICAGEILNLTSVSTTSGVSYSWTGPGSYTSSIQNPSISITTTAMSGNYIVTATLSGCIQKDTAVVVVKPMPTSATASNNGPVCVGDNLLINMTASSTGATYAWTGPNSFTSNTQNTSVANSTTSATGWYVATVDLNGCSFKDSTLATVNPIPAAPSVAYNNPLCVGEVLNLTATPVTGATYSWTGKNNFSSALQNPTRSSMQFGDTGTYKVTATVNGCTSAESSVVVNINPVPFVVIFPTPGDSICAGDLASFTALPNNHGGTPQYKWFVNGIPSGGNSPSYSSTTLNNGDVVRCDMTENTKCAAAYTDASNDVDMKVLPWLAPTVSITANPNRLLEIDEYVTFTATVTNGGNSPIFQWKRNGQNVQGATSAVWSANTLNDNDKITVELISNYKCPQPPTATSNDIVVNVATGVNDVTTTGGLMLYPNPNNGSFTLKGDVHTNDVLKLEITNMVGQLVYTQQVKPLSNQIDVHVKTDILVSGVYFMKLYANDDVQIIQFTVK